MEFATSLKNFGKDCLKILQKNRCNDIIKKNKFTNEGGKSMIGLIAFAVSIIGSLMSFFDSVKLPSFIIAILGIIIAVISAYYKDKKELKDETKKDSRALEVGAIIISGATCVSYYVFLLIA